MQNREMMTAEELAIAYAEMQLASHVAYFENDEKLRFTDTGLNAAWELWFNLRPKDRLSLLMLIRLIIEAGTDLDKKVDA